MSPADRAALTLAQRHVAEGRARVIRLRQMAEHLEADNHPDAAKQARALLANFERVLLSYEDDWERLMFRQDRRLRAENES
jgi:hypothetical protein